MSATFLLAPCWLVSFYFRLSSLSHLFFSTLRLRLVESCADVTLVFEGKTRLYNAPAAVQVLVDFSVLQRPDRPSARGCSLPQPHTTIPRPVSRQPSPAPALPILRFHFFLVPLALPFAVIITVRRWCGDDFPCRGHSEHAWEYAAFPIFPIFPTIAACMPIRSNRAMMTSCMFMSCHN